VSRVPGIAGLLLLLGVYACDAGHGFVKDDFNWILTSRIERPDEIGRLLGAATGFFRPVVSFSFALDYWLFGLDPLGYGLTNLVLALACVGALTLLLNTAIPDRRIAVPLALLWALNFHAINMAVLWISGRTALLVTLFAVAAAWAWTRGFLPVSALLAMTAMWAKEEALILPAIFTAWALLDPEARIQHVVRRTWAFWVVAAVSLGCRTWAGAFTPGSAPDVYRYRYDIATLGGNALAYLDRAGTTPLLALLVFWLAAGRPRLRGALDAIKERAASALVWRGAVWLIFAFVPTILLPVRSSLYAVLPSVGVVMIVGGIVQGIIGQVSPAARVRAVAVMTALFVALAPAYRLRNARYVAEAELSAAILGEIPSIAAAHPKGGLVLIRDARDARPTAEQAFGPLADRAARLVTDGTIRLWIDPPPAELAGAVAPADLGSPVAILEVKGGSVRRID
jgi:hypothetical protein